MNTEVNTLIYVPPYRFISKAPELIQLEPRLQILNFFPLSKQGILPSTPKNRIEKTDNNETFSIPTLLRNCYQVSF
jgi:hypothetical protein